MSLAHLPTVLRTLDALDPTQAATLQAVLTASDAAGRPVTPEQAQHALATVLNPASAPSVPTPAPPRPWWRRVLGELGAPEVLAPLSLVGLAGVAKSVYGTQALTVMTSADFNGLVLLVVGIWMGASLLMGTMATAEDGEALGQRWASVWTPVRISLLGAFFLPLFEHASAFSHLVRWVWG